MNQRSIIIFILLSIVVFTGLALYGDAGEIVGSILVLSPVYWLAALGLTVAHILFRLLRWNYYLKVIDSGVDGKTSSIVFLSGLGMIMIPGRVGELAKSFFLKQKLNTPIRLTAPVVVVERIFDVSFVLFLGLWGLVFIPHGWIIVAITLVGIAGLVLVLRSHKGMAVLVTLPVIRKWEPIISDSGEVFRKLFSPKISAVGIFLSALSWISVGMTLWIVLVGLGADIQIPISISIFSASTLLGSITMLPGGLVSTEGSMLAMLGRLGLTTTIATAGILIVRVVTLWFSVLVGLVFLIYLQKYQPGNASQTTVEANDYLAPRLLDTVEPMSTSRADS